MALTYTQQSQKLTDQALLARVNQAAIAQAIVVMGEQTSVPGHDIRAAYAQSVLRSNLSVQITATVLTSPNCGTGSSDPLVQDDALLYTVALNWNTLAGYSANQ